MTSFVVNSDIQQTQTGHAGVERVQRAAQHISGGRSTPTVVLAALVAALVVVANRFADSLMGDSMLAGWAFMWLVVFAGMALLGQPAYRAVVGMRKARKTWAEARERAHEEERHHNVALREARMIADLSRAMNGMAVDNIRRYD